MRFILVFSPTEHNQTLELMYLVYWCKRSSVYRHICFDESINRARDFNRRGVGGGRLERWCWSICPKQPLSRCCCRPLVREAQLLLGKKKKNLLSRIGVFTPPPPLHPQSLCLFSPPPFSAQTALQEDEMNQRAQPLCSQPARLQFQTSLDHFSCSPEMNNAHINWCQLINFRLTALYFSIRV